LDDNKEIDNNNEKIKIYDETENLLRTTYKTKNNDDETKNFTSYTRDILAQKVA
jgi:hypothetical protein